jgi:nicotinamide mononucleotide transporter
LKQLIFALGIGAILTGFSILAVILGGWDFQLSPLEIAAVWTSYASTYLCVIQARLNYPIGIITTFLYSVLFFQWGLPAMALFNLYLVFSLSYGWWRWGPDDNAIPVTRTSLRSIPLYVLFGVGVWLLLQTIAYAFDTPMGLTDELIAVLSGVAQFLLDNKKLETWFVWAVVNILSIGLLFSSGLALAGIQYMLFLANTIWGYYMWKKSMEKTNA